MRTVTTSDTRTLRATKMQKVSHLQERIPLVVVYIFLIFLFGSMSLFYLIYGGILAAYRIGDAFQLSWLGYPVIFITYALMGMAIWRSRKRILRIPFFGALIRNIIRE